MIIAFAADAIDPVTRSGWSVQVQGRSVIPRRLGADTACGRPAAGQIVQIEPGIISGHHMRPCPFIEALLTTAQAVPRCDLRLLAQDHRSGRDRSPPGYVTVPLSRRSRTDVERHGLAAAGTFSPPDRAISPWPGRRADWHMWIMDVSGDALFPRRYLDEYQKRVFELHRCVERAREHNADAMRQAAGFLLDAADAHEQAAMAYELAGGNGHARAFQARAMRHRQAAAARRAAAAALASGVPKGRVGDDPRPHAAIPDGDPPGLPGEPDAGTDHLGVSCGHGHEQQRDTRFCELPRDITYRAVGPAQAVLLLAVLLLAAPTGRRATERVPTPMATADARERRRRVPSG